MTHLTAFTPNTSSLSLAFLFFVSFSASSATYYVSPTGNNTNAGSAAAPFATIQRGVDQALAGDTILVRSGTYGAVGSMNGFSVNINKAGTSSAPITLKSETRWGAVLDGEQISHSYINFGSAAAYWVIEGFDISRGRSGGIWSNSGARQLTIRRNHIHHIGNLVDTRTIGIVGFYSNEPTANVLLDGNVFNNIGRTNTMSNSFDHAIYSHGSYHTIINNVFYSQLQGWHIQTSEGFSNALIANNTFAFPCAPGYGKVGHIMLWQTNTNVTIRNNIFFNAKQYAIDTYALQISGSSIDNNIVYNSGGNVQLISPSLPAGCTQSNNRLNANPLLLNTSTAPYNFHLQSSSPAVNTGVTVAAALRDNDGLVRPQGTAYDLGAYEFLQTLVSDPFSDGGRTNGADPLDVAWYRYSTVGSLSIVSNQLQIDPATFCGATGRFSAITLGAGKTLSVTFKATFASTPNGSLRFGFHNSEGTPLTADGGTQEDTDDGYFGMINFPAGSSGVSRETGVAGNSILGGSDTSSIAGTANAVAPAPGISAHTYKLELQRNASGDLVTEVFMDNALLFTGAESNVPLTVFDEISVGKTAGQTLLIDNVIVEQK